MSDLKMMRHRTGKLRRKDYKKALEFTIEGMQVDQKLRGRGIGSRLVLALGKKTPGKELYLYTDSNCIYQFYDRKGFTREQTREIQMEIQGKKIPLTCMLYSIRF